MGVLNVVTVVLAVLVTLQESGQTTGQDLGEDTEPCLPCEELDQLKNDLMKMQAETDNTFSMLEANATKDRQALRHMWKKTHEQENRIVELEGQVGNLTGDKVKMDKQVGILTDAVNRLIHKKVVNVALGKAANQTSTHGPGAASRAVDGDTNTTFDAGTCTHTQEEDNPTWWVDLGQSYTVERVVIFNRQDNSAERLNPFNIHIGDSDQVNENLQCGGDHEIDVDEASISVSCHGMRGRYVAIDLPGPRRTLTLCEVKVFSAPKKWREDGRCGRGYPAEDGYPAECDPSGIYPCCSSNNHCGITAADCDCPTCVDYRNPLPATTSPATTPPATTPPATTPPATCPRGYVQFLDRCFGLSTDTKNYADARSACQAAGRHLAMPKDPETNGFLVEQIKNTYSSGSFAWFGLTDQVQEGTFVWEDGTPLGNGWSDWAPEQPDDYQSAEDCVHWTADQGYMWNDYPCSENTYYVCE
ncbi:CLEC10A [Branchiostoma lanceolatum]|uniref:CLEC10A protein n=1 Tax=Branchiostoma lanceolatum TaxID=7740 RepID=A0A8J9VZ13_BRALA|nr:CLEC10A [Branchiostoma lanceolatum]